MIRYKIFKLALKSAQIIWNVLDTLNEFEGLMWLNKQDLEWDLHEGIISEREYKLYKKFGKGLYYLASPYTHKTKKVMKQRLEAVNYIGAQLVSRIHCIYPISSSASLSTKMKLPHTFEYWRKLDLKYVERCDGMIIATLPGWSKSVGVRAEIEHCRKINKPIYLLSMKSNGINLKEIYKY